MKNYRKILGWIFVLIFTVGWLNAVVAFVVAGLIGGDAINGKIEAGVYYLGGGGGYTEVTKGLYIYSYIHIISAYVTIVIGFISGVIFIVWQTLKAKKSSVQADDSLIVGSEKKTENK